MVRLSAQRMALPKNKTHIARTRPLLLEIATSQKYESFDIFSDGRSRFWLAPIISGRPSIVLIASFIDYDAHVTPLGWLASVTLFLQLPIPLFWFVLHPQIAIWRRHRRAAYIT